MLRRLKNILHFFEALFANLYYRFPSKKLIVIGVTGTDGKTTTTTLIHHLLTTANCKVAILSTLSSAHTTTPGRFAVQKFLRRSLENGCTHVVLEVTSIAVDQYRVWGTRFAVGVLTNTANNEHLDYHGTFEKYRESKIRFLLGCPTIVANAYDSSFEYLKSKITTQKLIPYSLNDWKKSRFQTSLIGDFNKLNILAATAVADFLGIDKEIIRDGVKTFLAPIGRQEVVITKPFTAIVDFAHTPQAFDNILPVIRDLRKDTGNRLIHVFGATGDRDRSKRPIMAEIAARCDDYVVLTTEDTYKEDPNKIIAEIEKGFIDSDYKNYEIIPDRREAIKKALELAKPGDVVLTTGVGHQRSINFGGKEIPWNEQALIKELVNGRKNH